MYAATHDALVVVDRKSGGDGRVADEFRARRRRVEADLACVAAHPDAPDRAVVGTVDDGIRRTDDAGETFESADALAGERVTALAVNPRDPAEWWAGTEPSAVYRSTDAGETWTRKPGLTDLPSAGAWSFPPRPDTHHVRWIEVDPADPARLYVSVEAGALVRTPDRGETWVDRVPSARRDNHSLATHSDAPGRVWAAAGDGYAETADAGETWTHPQVGLDHRYCWSVAVDPGDPGTVLLSVASGPRSAHDVEHAESYVYRRRTGGRDRDAGPDGSQDAEGRWERCDADLPAGEGLLRPVLAPGGEAGAFYALTNRGLYRTADAGESWTRLDLGLDSPLVDAADAEDGGRYESGSPRGLVALA